jgi:hypothetical protein
VNHWILNLQTALPRTNYIPHWLTLYMQCTGSTVGRSGHDMCLFQF